MRFRRFFLTLILAVVPVTALAQQAPATLPLRGSISGDVTDVDGLVIPDASITLDEPSSSDSQTVTANETGYFVLKNVDPTISHKIVIKVNGFGDWASPPITISPGQQLELTDIKLRAAVVETTVTAVTMEQLALEQTKDAEKQRVFGIIPNFYVSYDKNPVPLTPKLKYELAFKAGTDIASIAGDLFIAGINQAA